MWKQDKKQIIRIATSTVYLLCTSTVPSISWKFCVTQTDVQDCGIPND